MARKTSLNPVLTPILTWLAATYIRLVLATVRWEVIGEEHHRALLDSGQPFICAFWHARLFMMPFVQRYYRNRKSVMLISDHRDGEIIAQVIGRFGFETRRGSSADPRKPEKNKGGAGALKALISVMREGAIVGITPDGPRGPRQRAQAGVAQLSRLTGAPVLPIAYSVRHGKQFGSWDRFLLPFPVPFSRGVFVFGEPVLPPMERGGDIEKLRQDIENALNTVTDTADAHVGRKIVEPAAPARPLEKAGAT